MWEEAKSLLGAHRHACAEPAITLRRFASFSLPYGDDVGMGVCGQSGWQGGRGREALQQQHLHFPSFGLLGATTTSCPVPSTTHAGTSPPPLAATARADKWDASCVWVSCWTHGKMGHSLLLSPFPSSDSPTTPCRLQNRPPTPRQAGQYTNSRGGCVGIGCAVV